MPISDIPMFAMLRTRMAWHQDRQRVLAENVANADTPRFRPHDLVPLDFKAPATAGTGTGTAAGRAVAAGGPVALVRTDPRHIATSSGAAQFTERRGGYETRPSGNAVNLEDEMMKVAANQMDYQMATTLYSRGLGLIKTALGRG